MDPSFEDVLPFYTDGTQPRENLRNGNKLKPMDEIKFSVCESPAIVLFCFSFVIGHGHKILIRNFRGQWDAMGMVHEILSNLCSHANKSKLSKGSSTVTSIGNVMSLQSCMVVVTGHW